MLEKSTLGFLFCSFCSVAFSTGCSESKQAVITEVQAAEPMIESSKQSGHSASALKIEIDPRTGEIIPGVTSGAAAPEVVPEFEVSESPVSGGILSSSTGFATPLVATVDCDGKVAIGHGNRSVTSNANCQKNKGE